MRSSATLQSQRDCEQVSRLLTLFSSPTRAGALPTRVPAIDPPADLPMKTPRLAPAPTSTSDAPATQSSVAPDDSGPPPIPNRSNNPRRSFETGWADPAGGIPAPDPTSTRDKAGS